MRTLPGIKIVKKGPHRFDTAVYDLESGEEITNIYGVEFVADASMPEIVKVKITAEMPVEYEGPVDVVLPEEAGIGPTGRQSREALLALAQEHMEAMQSILRIVAVMPVEDEL